MKIRSLLRSRRSRFILLGVVLVVACVLLVGYAALGFIGGDTVETLPKGMVEQSHPDYEIDLLVRRLGSDTAWAETATIAAGGMESDVHRAEVELRLSPPLDGETEVRIGLYNGGAGHKSASWYWAWKPRMQANLQVPGGDSFVAGSSDEPLVLTPTDTLTGVLTSSNMVESTTIMVHIPALGVVQMATVSFDTRMSINTYIINTISSPNSTWTTVRLVNTLDGAPVEGHDIVFVVTKLRLQDGTVEKATIGDFGKVPRSLAEYVEFDGPGGIGKFGRDRTNSKGVATSRFRIINPQVVRSSLEVTCFDLDVAP